MYVQLHLQGFSRTALLLSALGAMVLTLFATGGGTAV